MKKIIFLLTVIIFTACKKDNIKPQQTMATQQTYTQTKTEADLTNRLFNQKWQADSLDKAGIPTTSLTAFDLIFMNPVIDKTGKWSGDYYNINQVSGNPVDQSEKCYFTYKTKLLQYQSGNFTLVSVSSDTLVLKTENNQTLKLSNKGTAQ